MKNSAKRLGGCEAIVVRRILAMGSNDLDHSTTVRVTVVVPYCTTVTLVLHSHKLALAAPRTIIHTVSVRYWKRNYDILIPKMKVLRGNMGSLDI